MKFTFIYSLPFVLLISLPSFSQEPAPITDYFLLCKNLKVVRTLRVEKTKDRCTAYYTKAGIDKVVGTSIQPDKCRNFADQVRDNIVKAGWKCREIKSEVTHLNE